MNLTPEEIKLIDGMIEVQQRHAEQCDQIANRPGGNVKMAMIQKTADLARMALLEKIKCTAVYGEPVSALTIFTRLQEVVKTDGQEVEIFALSGADAGYYTRITGDCFIERSGDSLIVAIERALSAYQEFSEESEAV